MREHNVYAVAIAWQLRRNRLVTKAIAVIAKSSATALEQGKRFAAGKFPGVPVSVSIQELPPEVLPDRDELVAEVAFLQRENQALRDALLRAQGGQPVCHNCGAGNLVLVHGGPDSDSIEEYCSVCGRYSSDSAKPIDAA